MLHLIIGLMNSGKTLYMTYKLYQDFLQKRQIYANYKLGFPSFRINKDYIEDIGKTGKELLNISIGVDESWIYWDARKSAKNVYYTNFVLQSSKDDTKLYLTAQNNNQQDLRIRNNAHIITTCERGLLDNGKFKKITSLDRILPPDIQNNLYIKAVSYSFKLVGMVKMPYKYSTEIIKASDIFKLYNTHEKKTESG